MTTRVAVVTGANRGIGRETACQLAQRGDFTVVLTARDEKKGRAAARELHSEFHPLDVTSERSIAALAAFLGKTWGRCDVLVNNAGILADPRGSGILASKIETHRATLETNVLGPLMLAQALVPLMRKNRYGRIVNVSSAMGQLSDMGTGSPAYRISKTALNAVTLILAALRSGGSRHRGVARDAA